MVGQYHTIYPLEDVAQVSDSRRSLLSSAYLQSCHSSLTFMMSLDTHQCYSICARRL